MSLITEMDVHFENFLHLTETSTVRRDEFRPLDVNVVDESDLLVF